MSLSGFELGPPPVQRADAAGGSRRRIAASGRLLLVVALVLVWSTPAAGALTPPDRVASEASASGVGVTGPQATIPGQAAGIAVGSLPSLGTSETVPAQNESTERRSTVTETEDPDDTDSGTATNDAEPSTTTETATSTAAESTETAVPTTSTGPATESPTATETRSPRGSATATETAASSPSSPTAFEVTNVSAPGAVRAGADVTVTATVTNPGTATATGHVNYSLAGRTADSERVSLDAGESTRVTFTGSTADLDPGTYVHGVRNETGAGTAQRLRVTPDVDVSVREMEAPTELSRGEPYVVLATVHNPAETTITREVRYTFDGVAIASKQVTVATGDSERVAFEVRTEDLERAGGPIANGSTHTHAVVADGGSRSGGEVLVRRGAGADPSALAVEEFRTGDDLRPGDEMTVNVSVLNVDEAVFEGQFAYRINGSAVDTAWVRVPVDERRTVTFTVTHAALDRRGVIGSSGETDHGVWVGETALRTRPLTVHGPFETETATDAATFTRGSEGASPGSGANDDSSDDRTGSDSCERGLLSPCGGTGFDETTLTLIGIATSVFGILYEMTNG